MYGARRLGGVRRRRGAAPPSARRDETGDQTRGTGVQGGWGRAGPDLLPLRRGGDQARGPGSGHPADGWLSRYASFLLPVASNNRHWTEVVALRLPLIPGRGCHMALPLLPRASDHEKRRARRNGRALKGDALTWD